MFQERLQKFECDQCHLIIPKSQPVRFDGGRHFCTNECHNKYLNNQEELIRPKNQEEYYM